jgi:hypothetical protein
MRLNRTLKRVLLSAAVVVPSAALVGCNDYDFDDMFDGDRDREVRIERDRIPSSARMLDGGHGEVSARVQDRGMAYIYDVNDQRVIWTGPVREGDRITIDPENDRAAVNGDTVYKSNLVRDHEHRIYISR